MRGGSGEDGFVGDVLLAGAEAGDWDSGFGDGDLEVGVGVVVRTVAFDRDVLFWSLVPECVIAAAAVAVM